jgi:hypothetical protein
MSGFFKLFRGYLEGKWEDSDFVSQLTRLLLSMYTVCGEVMVVDSEFEAISVKIVEIYSAINFYEIRRDILKLW